MNITFPIGSEFNRPKYERHEGCEYLPRFFIPWEMIAPHEEQSQTNHQQSLKRIAERGGFSRCEAIAILEDRLWTRIDVETADKQLKKMVEDWISKNK
jgi:hypothetical protein